MTRRTQGRIGLILVGLFAATSFGQSGIDSFRLSRAIPADAMLVVHARDHDGRAFVTKQFERVWAAVDKQNFDKDLKRMLEALLQQQNGDPEAFEQQWRHVTDLAAGVNWAKLAKREFAFAMKLTPPNAADFVFLAMPPKDQVDADYAGLSAILESLKQLAPSDSLQLTEEERDGATVIRKLSPTNAPLGLQAVLTLTLARHEDVLLFGFGSTMVEQSLALLRGESDPKQASLTATGRFQKALQQLPPPSDGIMFCDMAKILRALRQFAQMAADAGTITPAEEDPTSQPVRKLAFLVPLVDAFRLWDYTASVSTTDGMKRESTEICVLLPSAKAKPFGKALYGGKPLEDPLKYVPQQATAVSAGSGLDLNALYDAIVEFIRKELPEGEQMIARWDVMRIEMPIDIKEDLLSWVGGGYTTFTAPIPTPFLPGTVFIIEVKDEDKAAASIEILTGLLNDLLAAQEGAGVEESKVEGLEGFKQVILPPIAMLIPGVGEPIFGVRHGRLFLANGPKVLRAALEVGTGKKPGFAENQQYQEEGLPLSGDVTGFAFKDLTGWGEQVGQMLAFSGMLNMIPGLNEQIAADPVARTTVAMVSKVSRVVKELNFYQSQCLVTTVQGETYRTSSVLHYKEPPKPKGKRITPPAESAPASQDEKPPASESTGSGNG